MPVQVGITVLCAVILFVHVVLVSVTMGAIVSAPFLAATAGQFSLASSNVCQNCVGTALSDSDSESRSAWHHHNNIIIVTASDDDLA